VESSEVNIYISKLKIVR